MCTASDIRVAPSAPRELGARCGFTASPGRERGDAGAQLKVAMHTRLRVIFVVDGVEAESESSAGLRISASLSQRAPLVRWASAAAPSGASRAALIARLRPQGC